MNESRRASKDRDQFLAFYDQTFDEAYRYAGRLCGSDRSGAEDLVHDAYTSLLRQLRADPSRDLQVGYLITSIRNRFIDRVRSAEREDRRLRLVAANEEPLEPVVMPSQLADLPERERVALVLRYMDDLPVSDVAEALGISTHAAESLLARARARLRGKDIRHA